MSSTDFKPSSHCVRSCESLFALPLSLKRKLPCAGMRHEKCFNSEGFFWFKCHLLSVQSPPTLQSLLWYCCFPLMALQLLSEAHKSVTQPLLPFPGVISCYLWWCAKETDPSTPRIGEARAVSGLFNTPHCCGFHSSFRAFRSDTWCLVPLSNAVML